MRYLKLLVLVTACSVHPVCEESLPVYVEPDITMSANLRLLDQNPMKKAGYFDDLVFVIDVENQFDETYITDYDVTGRLYCWLTEQPGIQVMKEFHYEIPQTQIALIPGKIFPVGIPWNQKFSNGKGPWDYAAAIPGRVYMTARAEIWILKEFNLIRTEEFQFYVTYSTAAN